MKKQNKLIILVVTILILLVGFSYFKKSEDNDLNTNKQVNNQEEIDTSGWVEYRNTNLGYKIKFPASFKAYSEMTGDQVELSNDAHGLYVRDKEKGFGFMLSQSGSANKTINEAFNYQKGQESAKLLLIGNDEFVYSSGAQAYFVKAKNKLLVFHFLAENEEDKNYISRGVLESFEVIE